jgi:hypothetical protein
MKKLASIISALFVMASIIAAPMVSAQLTELCADTPNATVCKQAPSAGDINRNKIYGPDGIFTKAVGLVSILVGMASVFMLILAGFKFITSAGNSTEIASAKRTIIFAIAGLLTTLFAQGMIKFVLDNL